MEGLGRILKEQPFFEGLDDRLIEFLAGCATNIVFKAGEFVFRDGEPAEQFYLVRAGTVSLEVFVPGRGALRILNVEQGELLGWSWLVEPYVWQFDARAMDPVRLISMDAKCVRKKCEEDHELGYQLLSRVAAVFASRLTATRTQLLDLYGIHR